MATRVAPGDCNPERTCEYSKLNDRERLYESFAKILDESMREISFARKGLSLGKIFNGILGDTFNRIRNLNN